MTVSRNKTMTWFDSMGSEYRGKASDPPPSGYVPHVVNRAQGSQNLLLSQGHPYHLLGKRPGDIGGSFACVRRIYSENSPTVVNHTVEGGENANGFTYRGKYFAHDSNVGDGDFPLAIHPSSNDMNVDGTRAINIAIPTKPISGLLTTLGELRREGLPALVGSRTWQARTLAARNAGDEYLNYQFGWLPLVNEIRTFADTVRRSDEITSKYERESGKKLHRTVTFPTEIETTMTESSGHYPAPTIKSQYFVGTSKKTDVTTVRTERWFSGAFTYHLPPQGSRARSVAIANKLYGTRLTPEVVWNLTPWTWAADWFGNVGTVMSNASALNNDGLVMHYGYMMRKRTVERTVSITGSSMRINGRSLNLSQTFTTIVKTRTKASPFGFGLTFDSFSGRQLAILGALGLTRGSTGMKYE